MAPTTLREPCETFGTGSQTLGCHLGQFGNGGWFSFLQAPRERAVLSAGVGRRERPRLLLGGLLTDISVEHYHWVAGGDKNDPDPTTVTERANLFLQRLRALLDTGTILTLEETYTGEVLRFLRRGKIVYHGKQAPDN